MWGAIASVAIGAYGARKTAKAMQGANDLDLAKLRREAEQNGFNPLTVLRATGGQGSTKGPSGNLASGAFFQTFAQGIPSILEANYNKKMKQAQLSNINASTENLLATEDINERSHFDIPLMINVFDDSGNVEDFKIINPELIEMSGQEITGSLGMLAAQYAAQHKVSIAKAKEILKNIIDNRRKNIGLEQVFSKSPPLETNGINKQSSFLDRLSHGFETGKWIFPEKKPKTRHGLTNNARKTQDKINGFVRSDY